MRDPRIDALEQVIVPVLERENLELVDIELKREAVGLVLRLYIDARDGKVNLDALAKATQVLNPILDASGIISQKYTLEVSSPGIDRPLTKPEHFKQFLGSKVKIKTFEPIENRKQFKGLLVEANDSGFVVEIDGKRYGIAYGQVSKARLNVDIVF